MNTHVRDNLTFLGRPPSVRVTRSTSQSIANNTWTAISWNTEGYDTDSMWSSTAGNRIEINTNGKFLVTSSVDFVASTGGVARAMGVRVDATTASTGNPTHGRIVLSEVQGGGGWAGSYTTVVSVTSTQRVKIMVLQDSGAALNINDEMGNPHCSVTWISS